VNDIDRIENLLSDKTAVPWKSPSAALRERILSATVLATKRPSKRLGVHRWTGIAAAAALIATGWFGVYWITPPPPTPRAVEVSLDPSPIVDRLLQQVSTSMEGPLTSEARQFLDHADQVARNVLAQVPFTGTR